VELSVSSQRHGSVLTVAVAGDIDISASGVVETAISDAVTTEGVTAVTVDLAGVHFLDSSGVTLLLKGRRLADERAVRYRVTGADGFTRQVLEMTGVWEHLTGDPGQAEPTVP
jgi:anti-sigma B factor antagonist